MARKAAIRAVLLVVVLFATMALLMFVSLARGTFSSSVVVRSAPNVTGSASCDPWIGREELCSNLNTLCPTASVIDYIGLFFCSKTSKGVIAPMVVVEMIMLFFLLGASADKFLVPSLRHISDTLHVPPDIAGITLMALANGAPDVFGTVVAVQEYSYGISAGELLGAGLFVTTVVVGGIALVSKATVEQFPFLRDTGFYVLAIAMFFGMLLDGYVSVWDASLMLLYYVAYVVFAAVFAYRAARRQRLQAAHTALPSENVEPREDVSLDPVSEFSDSATVGADSVSDFDSAGDDDPMILPSKWRISVVDAFARKWRKKSARSRVFWLFFAFLRLPLTLTCIDVRWHKWSDCYFPATTFVFSPFVVVLATGTGSVLLGGIFPVWALGLMIGVVAAILTVVFLRKAEKPGKWVALIFSVWTFVLSILWIYLLAHELVAILQALGKLFRISDAILGATVLAWGSSVGDTVSNILVAKQGSPQTSVAAAFGGPLFNLLFGSSISLLYMTIKLYPAQYPAPLQLDSLVTGGILMVNVGICMAVVHFIGKYTIPRWFSIWLFAVYLGYDVVLVLFGTEVLRNPFIN